MQNLADRLAFGLLCRLHTLQSPAAKLMQSLLVK